jgi:hypothetical protein
VSKFALIYNENCFLVFFFSLYIMECDLYRKDIVCFKIPWLLFLEYLLVTEVGFDDFDILLHLAVHALC